MYRMRPGTGDEFALIMLPVVLLLMLLFNAARTGKFGLRLSEKIHRLSARIQAILDQTDADERLQEALSRMQQNWHQRISAFRHTRRRLHAAFPKRAENVRLRNIRDLVNALDEHLRGRGE